jgi:hypothetical protein
MAIGVATALKLYPAVLLPLVLAVRVTEHKALGRAGGSGQRWRDLVVIGAVFATVVGIGLILPSVVASQVNHQPSFLTAGTVRPVEIESIPGTILWLSHIAGIPLAIVDSYGARNYDSPLEPPLRILSGILTVCGLLFTYWGLWRGKFNGRQAFLLAISIVVITSKVLSPQYLIWLVPLVAIAARLSIDWILVAALTLLEYPLLFSVAALDLRLSSGLFVALAAVVALRNLALLVAVGRFAWGAAKATAVAVDRATIGPGP